MKNNKWVKDLLATQKAKPPKKKAVIPEHERAMFKQWQLAEYKAKYAHMAEHLRPKPKAKTWTRYSNFLEEGIQQWARTFGYTANKVSTQGTYRPGIGFTFGGATKGVEDLQLFIQGKMYALEVKVGKDVQSDAQKARQQALEAQGFEYLIIAHLEQFAKWAKQFEF
jgi:hypothetical protein